MAYPILAPNSTWYKSTQKRSTITEINIVDGYGGGTADETWNADVDNSGSIKCYRTGTVLTIAGNGSGKIAMNADSMNIFAHSSDLFTSLTTLSGLATLDASNVTTLNRAFDRCTKVTTLDVGGWDTSKVEDMNRVFQCCLSLNSLDLSEWNVSSCKTFESMFQGHASMGAPVITSIGDVTDWDTSSVTNMSSMFAFCTSLSMLDLSGWDVSNVTDMRYMFGSTSAMGHMALSTIGDISGWKPRLTGEGAQAMFQTCSNLTAVDVSGFDMSQATTTKNMFTNCQKLTSVGDLSKWNTSNITDMSYMFSDCYKLQTVDLANWDVSKVTTFAGMFCGADYGNPAMKITALDFSKWDTSSATKMSSMFYGCKNLGTVNISNWDVSKVETFDHFIAHSSIKLAGDGVARWVTSSAKTMDAMLYSCQNEVLDVSNFDTSNVLTFNQMFESCTKLKRIIGLENFVTSASLDFSEMFWNCISLEELNLSAFDTRNATVGADRYGRSNEKTTKMVRFFDDEINSLKKVILGKNFSFNGDGLTDTNNAILPTPSGNMWYNASGESFAPSDVPDRVNATYFASYEIVDEDMLIKHGTMAKLSDAVRIVTENNKQRTISEMIEDLSVTLPDGEEVRF